MRDFSVFVGAALVATACLTSSAAWAQAKPAEDKPAEAPPLPPAQARLWVIAPKAVGPWTMRIENEGSIALRIPADGRLLRLEVQTDDEAKPISCVLPSSLRATKFPEDRALLLAPGNSYVETFDPQLYCFGKSAVQFGPNMLVHARFGWDPPKATKTKIKPKKPKPPTGPFAVESTEREPTIAPLWEVQAPSIVLGAITATAEKKEIKSDATNGEETKPDSTNPTPNPRPAPPPVDERAGKIELTSTPFIEASAPRSITINVTAKNVGLRPIVVALRQWMMSFRVEVPGGDVQMCYADNTRRVLPSDAYRPLAPAATTSFTVLLAEVCPKGIFSRPGLYRVTPTIAARETVNQGIDVKTTNVATKDPTFIRLTSSDEPFYAEPPKATPPAPVKPDSE